VNAEASTTGTRPGNEWGWDQLRPWLEVRLGLPIGPLFCAVKGKAGGRPWTSSAVRSQLRHLALLGHANLGVTSIYLQGIDSGEIIETVRGRQAPVIPAAAGLIPQLSLFVQSSGAVIDQ
jgi:hypothetical protein